MKKLYFSIAIVFSSIIIMLILLKFIFYKNNNFTHNLTIKVGVLFSQTGTMSDSEIPVARATLLAIDEINNNGGINGKRIIPVIADPASDNKKYAALASKMILEDNVKVIFGCWTSASRKEVKTVVEKYNSLLVYPTQYEGVEDSSNIIYLGATPNQQLIPAASWMFSHYKKKVFIVGSDYIFPHVANQILINQTMLNGGEVLGTRYIRLGSNNVDDVINEIIQKNPDFIFNTINGSTNIAFFKRLNELTLGHKRPPVMSFSLSIGDIVKIGENKLIGDYATWAYFSIQSNPENQAFLKSYQSKYGSINNVNDPAITIYSGVYLWAYAARDSKSDAPDIIRSIMLGESIASPAGVIYIDPANGNAWRTVNIAKIDQKGVYTLIWTSGVPIRPIVYPEFKTKAEWSIFEYDLYQKWGESWDKN